jgi:hypothetical protein
MNSNDMNQNSKLGKMSRGGPLALASLSGPKIAKFLNSLISKFHLTHGLLCLIVC